MPSRHFLEPSTPASLANARERLESDNAAVQSLTGSIAAAEAALKKMVEEQRALIQALRDERTALEEDIKHIKGYVAPIRRLPHELVRAIIQLSCEDSSRDDSAWVIAAVCSTWRRLALNMPRLWSKIRLVTSPTASPDSIRLWLERSGTNEPLDIEITVQVQRDSTSTSSSSRPRWRTASLWGSHAHTYIQPVHYVQIHGGAQGTSVQTIPFHAALATLPPPSPLFNESWPPPATASVGLPPSPSMSATSKSRVSTHWGHVAFFYLVQQMYRWKRFVFRFDKPFPSYAAALQSIEGSAPLLEEFEIACAEPTFDHDSWVWLPTTNAASSLPSLRSVTLKHAPFKWNAPMLRNNLRSLSLHAYGPTATALDRLLQIVTANRSLAELNLNFSQVALPVLPLSTATLPELVTLSVGGHHALATLVDRLIVPALESLSLDFEPRDPLDECVTSLLTRSAHPPVTLLALGYGSPHGPGPSYLYHAGGLVTSWAFLADLPHLRTLRVGGAALDVLFATLASCEDDTWMCPRLTSVALRCCSAQIDAVMKLVRAVEARNPAEGMTAPAGAPAKFKSLSMSECGGIGEDVVEWLRARVEEVVFVEPSSDRWLAV